MDETDKDLEALLLRWKCKPIHDPDLRARVWRRIARAQEESLSARFFGWAGAIEAALARPALAIAVMAAAAAVGVGAAEVRISRQSETAARNMEEVYLTSINPVALASHHGQLQ